VIKSFRGNPQCDIGIRAEVGYQEVALAAVGAEPGKVTVWVEGAVLAVAEVIT
jgi:hypothetical protein